MSKEKPQTKPNLLPHFGQGGVEVGCDEAGRGCLAGPVVAAAVILPRGADFPFLRDSKQLNHRQRSEAALLIKSEIEHWAVGVVSAERIDEINILNASFEAMHLSLDQLTLDFDLILVDGNRFSPYREKSHECVIKGDGKYQSIAAASILAKTHRDALMEELDRAYPVYKWKQNKGYPTKAHRAAIAAHGSCQWHRKSFRLLPEVQLKAFE